MFLVRIISLGQSTLFKNKKEAEEYAKKIMREQGKSVSVSEIKS